MWYRTSGLSFRQYSRSSTAPDACSFFRFRATSFPSSVTSSRMHLEGEKAGMHTGMYVVSSGKLGLNLVPLEIFTVWPARTVTFARPSCSIAIEPVLTAIHSS